MEPRPDDTINAASQPEPSGAPAALPAAAPEPASWANAETAAAVEPVAATPAKPATPAGASRGRWLIGGGVAVAAIAAVALAASFLSASPLPEILKYLPADSAIVVELRPELPGDQRQKLGNLLAHFPGFEDQSTLDVKLDELLGRLTNEATRGEVDYTSQVKPLLAGPMAVAIGPNAVTGMMSGSTPDGILFVATTDGTATCTSIFVSTEPGSTYREVEIVSIAGDVGCAVHERYLLVGSTGSIEAGLDARLDAKGVDTNKTYREARSRLDGDQLASLFIEVDPIYDAILAAAPLGMDMGLATLPEGFWVIEGVRVDDDALILEAWASAAAMTLPSGAPSTAPAAESRFARSLPQDTLGYLELHGVGASVEQVLAVLKADPTMAVSLEAFEDALRTLGGTDNLTGWIEDLAVGVLPTDDAVGAVVLIRGTDAETAAARLTQIRNLVVLGSTGSDITLRDSDHNGVTVTTVDLGDVSGLLGSAGFPGGATGDRVEIAFAVRGDLVIIGGGGGLVERILDVEAGASLATSGTYDRIIDIAGAKNDMQLFVALDSTLALVERLLPADQRDMWTTELKPYLDHLAGAAMTSLASSSGGHSMVVITVK